MKNLKELNTIENQFIMDRGGVWNITEFDQKQNTISRNKIKAFRTENGACFLGKINRFEGLKEYTSGMVYNFEYDFAISEYNTELVMMLESYNSPNDGYDGKKAMRNIEEIFNKIEELNGTILNWV